MNPIAMDILMHYGTPRHSGRYPWGSGDNPYQHSGDFLSRCEKLKKDGYSQKEIADEFGMTTTQLRTFMSLAKDERRSAQVATAKKLRKKGYSLNEIAKEMGFKNDSSVRTLLNENAEARMNVAKNTADFLKKQVDEKGMIDVGAGVERWMGKSGISKEKMREALTILEAEGYYTFGGGVPQVTNPGKQTNIKVLCPPGTPYKINEKGKKVSSAVYDYENIHTIDDYISYDGGETFKKSFVYPESMDSKRLKIRYAEDGGVDKDGVIELRRGVADLNLGKSHYAQVRILVDGDRYLKGMAVYSDDMPDGVDVIFNTNKKKGTEMRDVLKKISSDPENPFGSLIKEDGGQSYYIDKDGKEKLSLINKRAEEGDWGAWADKLPSQFLSKQTKALAKKQLDLAVADKQSEYNEICSYTNPTVKKRLLKSFADDCDSAAVHLQAAALPRQKYQVILPLTTIKDTEVYAPNYNNGETVALIRYPHGGTFEIPILKVNNKQAEGKKVLGTSPLDGIGISKKVADRLSGADFDGDTVMVIPCNSSRSKVNIVSTKAFKELENFDPKMEYGGKKEGTFKPMKDTQKQMGSISNLISDMTLKGAPDDEVIRAVRHSMVVIDAEKHKLDYKQSEVDNGIAALKKKWQGRTDPRTGKYREGASTLISLAKSQVSVPKRQGSPNIDKETGRQTWRQADDLYYTHYRTGKKIMRTQKSTEMAETDDAHTLSSGLPMEELYADYANSMKALANSARKEMLSTGKIKYKSSAKTTYQKEVDLLNAKLNIALKNAPRERQAQTRANASVAKKIALIKQENPAITDSELKKTKKKLSQQELTKARLEVGAKRTVIDISDREWEAIQAGAISENQLNKILNNTDIDRIKERATPRARTSLSSAKESKINAMRASGYTIKEIADAIGVSASTVSKYLK